MRKLTKLLFSASLSTLLLAGCSAKSHTVEFYANNLGEFYTAVIVGHNEKIARPKLPPAPINFNFEDWFADMKYEKKFDFAKPIKKDTQVFAKWKENRPYVSDERKFHVVGELNNPDVDYINWEAVGEEGVTWDVRSYLVKDADTNLFTIELPIGEDGQFKVKVAGVGWGGDLEFGYGNIDPADYNEHIEGADYGNIKVLTAGLYKIEVETTFEWAKVTRIGD